MSDGYTALICDVLSDIASDEGLYKRRARMVLEACSPSELEELYKAFCSAGGGREQFLELFTPRYYGGEE